MTEPKHIKIRYGPRETGWAEDLGDGTYRIANLPALSDLNPFALVTIKETAGDLPHIEKVLNPGHIHRFGLTYPDKDAYAIMQRRTKEHWPHIAIEGYLPPRIEEGISIPGIAGLSFDDTIEDLSEIFDGLDVELERL